MTPDPADPRALLAVLRKLVETSDYYIGSGYSDDWDEALNVARAALAAASLPAQQRPAPESGAGDEVIERAARAAATAWEYAEEGPDEWPSVVRAVLAVAQPAPPPETVSVLDGLLAEMLAKRDHGDPWRECFALVEAARRRVGGEK